MFKEAASLAKKDKAETLAELVENVSPLMPALGGVVGSVIGALGVAHRFERMASFIMKLAIEVHQLGGASADYIRSEDFADIFYQTMTRVHQEGLEDKRVLYGTFLKNAVSRQLSYAEYSRTRMSRLVEDLLPADVAVLSAFARKPEEFKHTMVAALQTAMEGTKGLTKTQVAEIIEHVDRLGLVNIDRDYVAVSPGGSAQNPERWLTPLGQRVLAYLQ